MSERMAVSMAGLLEISISGVAKGAAGMGKAGVNAATGVVKGIGGTVQGLFGGKKK
jgi:hypothetical protein